MNVTPGDSLVTERLAARLEEAERFALACEKMCARAGAAIRAAEEAHQTFTEEWAAANRNVAHLREKLKEARTHGS